MLNTTQRTPTSPRPIPVGNIIYFGVSVAYVSAAAELIFETYLRGIAN